VTMGLCDYYAPPDDVTVLAEAMKKILLEQGSPDINHFKMISDKMDGRYNHVQISKQYYDLLMSLISN